MSEACGSESGPGYGAAWRHGGAVAALVLLVGLPALAFPPAAELLTAAGLSADQAQQVLNGQLVSAPSAEISERELGVTLAFLVKDTAGELEKYFQSGASYKLDSQVAGFGAISGAGTPADFSGVALTPDGARQAQAYLAAAPGESLNLSPQEIAAFNALQSKVQGGAAAQEVVTAELQQLLLARYQAYRAQGLAGIAPYARAGGKLYQPANDLRKVVEALHVLNQYAPQFHTVLLQYPQSQPPGLQEAFFWLNYTLDGAPNFTLVQRMALQIGERAFVLSSRQYYSTRVYNTVQEVAGMLPMPEGTLVIYSNRTSTDQAAGFGSSVKHSIGEHMMASELSAIFAKIRSRAGGP